jgi:integrase
VAVGWVDERINEAGQARYTAMYRDLKGRKRSAGTFTTERRAVKEWHKAEAQLAAGRIGDRRRGLQTLRSYVENEWFPNHVIEATTRETYTYLLDRYILPDLGSMRIGEILPGHVREWVTRVQDVHGAKPPTIRKCKVILDAIFTTALNDQITYLHAGKGVKTPPVATKPRAIVTAEQFDLIHSALDDDGMQLLVETDIETGLRWGELTELRVKDVDLDTGVVTVCRAVVHLRAAARGSLERFVVKEYPKDKEWRRVTIAEQLVAKLRVHIERERLGSDDLLFSQPQRAASVRRIRPSEPVDASTLGLTEPNSLGRRYPHGTTTAYGAGRCRCRHCKDAIATYRASRRAAGRDAPQAPRAVLTDGHVSGDWFRTEVWAKALAKADLGVHITPHGLRHAHASWLLAGGADLQVVKERLGHGSITTTEKYLHALPGGRDAALDALATVRGRGISNIQGSEHEVGSELDGEASIGTGDARPPELAEVMDAMARIKDLYDSLNGRNAD